MDELYYEDGQVPDLASSGFTFSDEVIAKALVGIYKGEVDIDKGVEQNLYKETLRILNKATAKGMADAIDGGAPAPKKDFLYQLRHSNEVFSAFKTHTQQNHLADLLTDSKGKLKPFGQFAKDSESVIGKYNRQWLRTEYDTAVIRAHQAANWQKFEEEKDILPNLEWIPSTSPNPSEDHMVFWGTILPVDDGFWDAHRPGDRWNCKCDLRSTDKAATHAPDTDIITKRDEPARGLNNNPGKDGKIFNQSHPYFPKSCAACPFSSNGKPSPLADKIVGDCNNCGNVPSGTNKVQKKEPTYSVEEKREIYARPIEEQIEKVEENIYRHLLKEKTSEDYERVLATARLYAKKEKVIIMAEIHKSEIEARKKWGIKVKNKNADIKLESGWIDAKSPYDPRNIVRNANGASAQGAIACISDDFITINMDDLEKRALRILHNGIYNQSEIHFKIGEKLYRYNNQGLIHDE